MSENTETENMPITSTSISTLIFGNIKWLMFFIFYPLMNWMISELPDWKEVLENFKLIGGSIIIILVISKLLLEIVKLIKSK